MNYFISDLHLGHENVIGLCGRPFGTHEEMDETLIANWNARVKGCDTVYIVGDLIWQTADPKKYLVRLKGNKVLIVGNHDEKWLARYDCKGYFAEITPYMQTRINNVQVTLCHYPMVEWKASRKLGSKKLGFHIYGHIHNGYKDGYLSLFKTPHAFNAGADINGFAPVTFEELAENNEKHVLSNLNNAVDRAEYLSAKYNIYRADGKGTPIFELRREAAAGVVGESEKCAEYLCGCGLGREFLSEHFSPEIVDAVLRREE